MSRSGRARVGGAGLAAIAALVVLLASGCGYGGVETASSHGDPTNGKTLFKQSCGACHTLQDAGTSGTIGPNLDNAFAGSRDAKLQAMGYAESTIENVVLDQIRQGSGPTPPLAPYTNEKHFTSKKCLAPTAPGTQNPCYGTAMPANLFTGQDALDVAAYVASVAGTSGYSGGGPVGVDGAALFKSAGCAGCHTLTAAGSTGTVGPDLNTAIAADANAAHMALAAFVMESIVNPSAYIAKGFSDGIMPAFKGTLTDAQIKAVAQYVVSNTGK